MGIKNKIVDGYAYFLTMTVVNWIDVFTRPVYKHIIVDALKYNQENKGLILYAWCLMSNHLHLIAEIVENAHEYLYSSAKNYAGELGIIDVVII